MNYITSHASLALTDDIFESRNTLTRWVYDLHNEVNRKTDNLYSITYDEVVLKYTSPMYIHTREAPYLPFEVAAAFMPYAIHQGITDYAAVLNETREMMLSPDRMNHWTPRNESCWSIIESGDIGLQQRGSRLAPTIDELNLFKHMATSLPRSRITELLEPRSRP